MLPNLIIIGAVKSGTTSLHYYLGLHPQVSMSKRKELNFFVGDLNWHKGLEWYQSFFTGEAVIFGESSPNYTDHPHYRGVPERMHSVVPAAKLIYIVRDPVERIISNYVQRYAIRLEDRTFGEAMMDLEDNLYVQRSRYFFQLERYFPFYPKENILVISTEAMLKQREQTLRKTFEFLGVDPSFRSPEFSKKLHSSRNMRRKSELGVRVERVIGNQERGLLRRLPPQLRYRAAGLIHWTLSSRVPRAEVGERLRRRLVEYLRDDVENLRAYTGEDFPDWCL